MLLGSNLAAGMALFGFAGHWLDRRLGEGVAWTVGGLIVGLLFGAYEVWKICRLIDPPRPPPKGPP